jgi:UTP--glucose-1-phosphate uridylyltransferase
LKAFHEIRRGKILKAVIPAAGLGTRMLPATKAVPKELLPVAGKPLVQYAVEEALASQIETVILVVRSNQSLIQAYFSSDDALESLLHERHPKATTELPSTRSARLLYVEQKSPRGLADAICCARALLGQEHFVVLLPDVIILNSEAVTRQLMHAYDQCGGSVVAIREVPSQDVERHGIVQIDRSAPDTNCARIIRLVEKPSAANAPSLFGVFGRYLLAPSIWDAIAQTKPDPHGEVQLTDALNLLCQTQLLTGLSFEGQPYDAGDPLGYLKANIELSLRNPLLRPALLSYLSILQSQPDRTASPVR